MEANANQRSDLSENETLLMAKISENNLEEVKQLLNEKDVRINCCDENGMSGLEHSAYKGNYDICKYLLERGADVNQKQHIHGYTALMFAALGGHHSAVNLLLEHNADINAVNSVGRNAAQMAAFVGQHSTVAIINNFIPRDQIEYYSRSEGSKKEPIISGRLVSPLHLLVRQTNVHPIRVGIFLKNNWVLVENGIKIIKVLDLLAEKQFRQLDPNEIISIKFHYLAFLLRQILKHFNKSQNKDQNETKDTKEVKTKKLESLLKSWLKCRQSDEFPEFMEQLLRQSIREYPYHESALFQQLVRTLANVEIGSEPSAVSILSQAINGQKSFDENIIVCGSCAELNPTKRCGKCKQTYYCDIDCQRLHWSSHKLFCKQ